MLRYVVLASVSSALTDDAQVMSNYTTEQRTEMLERGGGLRKLRNIVLKHIRTNTVKKRPLQQARVPRQGVGVYTRARLWDADCIVWSLCESRCHVQRTVRIVQYYESPPPTHMTT